jgi:Zn-dependent peptidase ImmA (M78 family)
MLYIAQISIKILKSIGKDAKNIRNNMRTTKNKYNTLYSSGNNLENLRKNYFKIRKITNELLKKYNENSFIRDPSVDIRTIASEKGIISIDSVAGKEINNEHAFLIDKKIKLNKADKPNEHNFSIAHDLKHFLLEKEEFYKRQTIIFKKPYLIHKKPEVIARAEVLNSVARYAGNPKPIKINFKLKTFFKYISKNIAEVVSENIGKNVTTEKAYNVLIKIFNTYIEYNKYNIKSKIFNYKNLITDAINKLVDEELADYFAANLLVPTSRFLLWKDKSNRQIAKAFRVPVKCIIKRRKEIQHEINFTTIKCLSSNGESCK